MRYTLVTVFLACAILFFSCKGTEPEPPKPPVPTKYEAVLDVFTDSVVKAANIPGLSIAVVEEGLPAWAEGYGFSDLGKAIPATKYTRYLMAQSADPVVAAAVLQAVTESGLDLDAPVNQYLPFAVRHPLYPTAVITLRMLLSHTAGLADDSTQLASLYGPGDTQVRLRDFLKDYFTVGSTYYSVNHFTSKRPGKTYQYSRIGIALAALAVENRTGVGFDLYCKTHLFLDLGFSSVSWYLYDLQSDLVALPYMRMPGGNYQAQALYGYPMYPSGSLRVSSELMARFLSAALSGGVYSGQQVLSSAQVEDMLRVQNPFIDPSQALGWDTYTVGGRSLSGIKGSDKGYSSCMYISPATGSGVVILANTTGIDALLETLVLKALSVAEQAD
ncbi:MAG: class C beta-lactamase-related serine hydrolase [Bacteroidetes bacterium]|nr:MAG: class C beta-lactamase-related serine hydrolase [Bacteroidota bacterium]